MIMTAGTWKPLGGDGIMVWEPVAASSFKDTQELLPQMGITESDIQGRHYRDEKTSYC